MSTKGRKKQTVATSVENSVSESVNPVTPVKRTTRSRVAGSGSKVRTKRVAVQKPKKVPVNPKVKMKIPVRKQQVSTDDERFEDAEDPEVESESEDESKLEIEKLRKRLAELESDKVTQKSKQKTRVPHHELSPPVKPMNPVEGEMSGTMRKLT